MNLALNKLVALTLLASVSGIAVVSINIRYDGLSFICSGTLVSKRDVVSAGHCVDTDGLGHVIDISKSFAMSGKDVRVVFNSEPTVGSPGRAIVTADKVTMNPKYAGFGNCAAAVTDPTAFCVNDDISVIHLTADAPSTAKIYKIWGDSGGPSFMDAYGENVLVGNNTFSETFFDGQVGGTFGTAMGGILMDAYLDFLRSATDGRAVIVPEPETALLVMLGLAAAGATQRRRKAS